MFQTNNLEKTLKELLPIHKVIAISGGPGVGKSEIAYQVHRELGLKMLEVRLYEQGSTAAGLPLLKTDITQFSKPWWFKELEEEDYDSVFFDDFHNVEHSIQKFFYRMLTDRMLHNYALNKDLKVIIAGNFDIDSAGACQIHSPIMGRIETFIRFIPNIDVFLNWAKNQIERFDTRILAFLKANPELLYEEDPAPTTKYPSPRTWEHLSRNISKLNKPDYAPAIVGERAGSIFIDFWEFLDKDLQTVLHSSPSNIKEEVVYAVILAKEYINNHKNIALKEKILKYVSDNLNPDIIFLFARNCYQQIGYKFIDEIKKLNDKKIYDSIYDLKKKTMQATTK